MFQWWWNSRIDNAEVYFNNILNPIGILLPKINPIEMISSLYLFFQMEKIDTAIKIRDTLKEKDKYGPIFWWFGKEENGIYINISSNER